MTFNRANILLPAKTDMTKWSVVACDQYTSEPEYWSKVADMIQGESSTYHLTLPEVYLNDADVEKKIEWINKNMKQYINDGVFKEYKNSLIYIERTQRNGKIRKGIVGAVDLETYDYAKGSKSSIRATEGTVAERIPPRLKVRRNAKLELPHVMLLIDDSKKMIIEYLSKIKERFTKLYDFDLMMDSGKLQGWLLDEVSARYVEKEFAKLEDVSVFNKKYCVNEEHALSLAVGDGNHSLATAKEYYNLMKEQYGDKARTSPARYALAEVVNLHDDALEFEAIHRVVFDVNVEKFENDLLRYCEQTDSNDGQTFIMLSAGKKRKLRITDPTANLTVGSVQNFIDGYIAVQGGRVDYIHGDAVVAELAERENTVGILLDAMDKNDLFKTVILDGSLPRKTFSMGEACDKRFYTEARIINENI